MDMKNITTKFLLQANVLFRLVAFMTILISANTMFAQSKGGEIGDLSSITWKDADLANTTLLEEEVKIGQSLSTPNLQDVDKAMYIAYKRLLEYIKGSASDLGLGKAIEDAHVRVLKEALIDQDIKQMPLDGFSVLVSGLVESLQYVPQAQRSNF
jgi:hypothetical protein